MSKNPALVVEFHYSDCDVGGYHAKEEGLTHAHVLWNNFTPPCDGHHPTHILIRLNSPEGQAISNKLHAATMPHGVQLNADFTCPVCHRDYNGHVQDDGVMFCTSEDCPSHPKYKE